MTEVNTEDSLDDLSDTGRKAVAEAVRRVKAELEMHRDLQEDMFRRVLKEERAHGLKTIQKIVSYALAIFKDPET